MSEKMSPQLCVSIISIVIGVIILTAIISWHVSATLEKKMFVENGYEQVLERGFFQTGYPSSTFIVVWKKAKNH